MDSVDKSAFYICVFSRNKYICLDAVYSIYIHKTKFAIMKFQKQCAQAKISNNCWPNPESVQIQLFLSFQKVTDQKAFFMMHFLFMTRVFWGHHEVLSQCTWKSFRQSFLDTHGIHMFYIPWELRNPNMPLKNSNTGPTFLDQSELELGLLDLSKCPKFVGPVFEFFEGRFGLLGSQGI